MTIQQQRERVDVVVERSTWAVTERFAAVLYVDGHRTTWECGHLHHSAAQAKRKCLSRLLRCARSYVLDPSFVEKNVGGSVEWVRYNSTGGVVLRRFRYTKEQ